jgi:hypothetical protein
MELAAAVVVVLAIKAIVLQHETGNPTRLKRLSPSFP